MQMPHNDDKEEMMYINFEATWSRLERVVDILQDETKICLDEAVNGSPHWPIMHLSQLKQRVEEVKTLIDMGNRSKPASPFNSECDINETYEDYMLREKLKDAKTI